LDLVVWLHGRTQRFPRTLRSGLGLRVENEVMELYQCLGEATTVKDRSALLRSASRQLDGLRRTLRVCLGLKLLTFKQFGYASGLIDEIGRMLGGWLRKESGQPKKEGRAKASIPRRGVGEPALEPV